ncbi:UNVERIFIED_ORG: hypothetical protein J2W65_003568 [Pseudomonas parafulva]|nr:hypothetical protein [Pseudomonas parafulva]
MAFRLESPDSFTGHELLNATAYLIQAPGHSAQVSRYSSGKLRMFSEDFYGIYLVVEAVVAFVVLAIAAHWSQGT